MRGRENGSALLMIMVSVAVAGVLFGALYVGLGASQRQAIEHELQVQAEFDAQKMMEIALYHFYQHVEHQADFEAVFTEAGHCLADEADDRDKVCLQIEKNPEGAYAKEVLTATGVSGAKGKIAAQTRVIDLDLLAMGGGGDAADGPAPPNPLPTGEVPEDSQPSAGQTCLYASDRLPVRALSVGTDLDLTLAKTSSVSETVHIEGGLYIPENRQILLPEQKNHRYVTINGLIYDEDSLQSSGEGSAKPDASALGDKAMRDTYCYGFPSFHDKVNEIADHAIRQNQQVPVYVFESADGIVTLDSKGKRKETMYQQFFDFPNQTLREVLADQVEKIVVVRGRLVLESPFHSHGYLVVYNEEDSAGSAIELPDGFVWHHDGGILTESIVSAETGAWPRDYQLTITLTKGQVKLYDQSTN